MDIVSVVVVTYKSINVLETFESIKKQDYKDIELIIFIIYLLIFSKSITVLNSGIISCILYIITLSTGSTLNVYISGSF